MRKFIVSGSFFSSCIRFNCGHKSARMCGFTTFLYVEHNSISVFIIQNGAFALAIWYGQNVFVFFSLSIYMWYMKCVFAFEFIRNYIQ